MKNKLCPEDIQFRFISSLGMASGHHISMIDDTYGIECEKISKVKFDGSFGNPKTYYFIIGQEKEYTDIQELCDDWNEIKDYDDPEREIVWIKVIRKKQKK